MCASSATQGPAPPLCRCVLDWLTAAVAQAVDQPEGVRAEFFVVYGRACRASRDSQAIPATHVTTQIMKMQIISPSTLADSRECRACPNSAGKSHSIKQQGSKRAPEVDQWIAVTYTGRDNSADKDAMCPNYLVVVQDAFQRTKCVPQ